MSAGKDRITEIRIRGMRSIDDITLKLDGLTVLIGENGSGKSTIVEACELLRKSITETFFQELRRRHGSTASLLRHGASSVGLAVGMELEEGKATYGFEIGVNGGAIFVEDEDLRLLPNAGYENVVGDLDVTETEAGTWQRLIVRNAAVCKMNLDGKSFAHELDPDELMLSLKWRQPILTRVRGLLGGIDVHLPFAATASWASRDGAGMRRSAILEPVDRLELFGNNLANALYALSQRKDWAATLDLIRLGLGDQVDNVFFPLDMAGGQLSFALRMIDDSVIRASAMSDGQLAYLAFVALYRLDQQRSLLVFDEPELHLHPHLIYRVVNMLENVAETQPVLICTHSNALLDMLRDPAKSTKLCELDERRATRIRSVDKPALDEWLTDYAGLGSIRSAGHENSLFLDAET